eukprot:365737-Chlamydomonas_euryale.AAC.10
MVAKDKVVVGFIKGEKGWVLKPGINRPCNRPTGRDAGRTDIVHGGREALATPETRLYALGAIRVKLEVHITAEGHDGPSPVALEDEAGSHKNAAYIGLDNRGEKATMLSADQFAKKEASKGIGHGETTRPQTA